MIEPFRGQDGGPQPTQLPPVARRRPQQSLLTVARRVVAGLDDGRIDRACGRHDRQGDRGGD
jgi:hypothetical protein